LHVGVEGLVIAETSRVCHGTIGVVKIIFKAGDLKIGVFSLRSGVDLGIREWTYGARWQAREVLSPEEGGEDGEEDGVEEHGC
jgi:hypothetical protein